VADSPGGALEGERNKWIGPLVEKVESSFIEAPGVLGSGQSFVAYPNSCANILVDVPEIRWLGLCCGLGAANETLPTRLQWTVHDADQNRPRA
jgi:hypothetical protein